MLPLGSAPCDPGGAAAREPNPRQMQLRALAAAPPDFDPGELP